MFYFQAGLQQSRFSLAQAQTYFNEEAKAPLSHDGGTRSLAPLGTHRKLARDPINSSIAYMRSHRIGFIDLRERIAVRIGFPANLLKIRNQSVCIADQSAVEPSPRRLSYSSAPRSAIVPPVVSSIRKSVSLG